MNNNPESLEIDLELSDEIPSDSSTFLAQLDIYLHQAQLASSVNNFNKMRLAYIKCIEIIKQNSFPEEIQTKGGLPSKEEIENYILREDFLSLWFIIRFKYLTVTETIIH